MQKLDLTNQWGIWFAYLSETEEKEEGYSNRLKKFHTLKTMEDLVYLWNSSPIASLDNFFVFSTPAGNKTISYPSS